MVSIEIGKVIVVVPSTTKSQMDRRTVLPSIVTAPFKANALPSTVAPVFNVMEVSAMMVPAKSVPVPNVAELPTCQKMLQASAPLISEMELFEAVSRVEPV